MEQGLHLGIRQEDDAHASNGNRSAASAAVHERTTGLERSRSLERHETQDFGRCSRPVRIVVQRRVRARESRSVLLL